MATQHPVFSPLLWEAAEREDRFWQKHREEFLHQYPERFVVVRNGEVIGTAPSLEELATLLDQQSGGQQNVWVRFITREPPRLLL